MAKVNLNFFKVFGLVSSVLTAVVRLVSDFIESSKEDDEIEETVE